MAAVKYDMVRLSEMRDAHTALVSDYQQSVRAVGAASVIAASERFQAPPLPGLAPIQPRHVFAPAIAHTAPSALKPRAATNQFYSLPLETLLSFSQKELDDAFVDARTLSRIIVAENRLAKVRAAHATKAAAVRQSADSMKHINLFATEKRL